MLPSAKRRNDALVRYLTALALALVTFMALQVMPFYPEWLGFLLAIGTGALAVASPATATLVFVGVVALPVIAADFVIGMAFLLVGLAATQYLSVGRAGGFVVAALAVAAIPLHAEWAVVAMAGYLLGRGRGALAGATACVAAVAAGLVLGAPALGTVVTGGSPTALVSFAAAPANALGFGWLAPAVKAADPWRLLDAFAGMDQPFLIGTQVALWALSGAAGSATRRPRTRALALAGPIGALAMLVGGALALDAVSGGPLETATLLTAAVISLPLVLVATIVAAWGFPGSAVAPTAARTPAPTKDVGDLLRTIASAEDELASRHKAEAVVLITDMKSFSSLTEEIGSMEAAKIVQRHRDLLLPLIEAHGGHGTPTGGDGLVAAFGSPAEAISAAVAMQRALEGYTGSGRSPQELAVRIGIASGEVVLDAAGCPFLGGALNLAARIMDFADGGRIMTTGAVAAAAGLSPGSAHAHGEYKLKNIAETVSIAEVLWRQDMPPQEIRAT